MRGPSTSTTTGMDPAARRAYAAFLRRLRGHRRAGRFPTLAQIKADAAECLSDAGGKHYAAAVLDVSVKTVYNHLPRDGRGELVLRGPEVEAGPGRRRAAS